MRAEPLAPTPPTPLTPPARAPLDREAPTRITPPSEPRVIVAPNDTQIGAGRPRGATLRMPDAPLASATTEMTAKRTQRLATTVTTRPKKDHAALAVLVAAALAIAMITGAIFIVRGRFTGK